MKFTEIAARLNSICTPFLSLGSPDGGEVEIDVEKDLASVLPLGKDTNPTAP